MVVLGGLELVAAGYLINRHQKNKAEARRIREEEDALEESRYRIYSASNAGPGRRRSHSHDRHERKHSNSHHRRHSHDRRHSRDDRRDERKYGYERPVMQRPHATSAPPPMYAPSVAGVAAPLVHQAARPTSAMKPAPPADQFPVTGWPANWEQTQRGLTPQPQPQPSQQLPANLAPYYRDPGQADVKYGFQDGEEDRDRGRAQLSPEDAHRHGGRERSRGSRSRSVRFDVPNRRQPGDEPPPMYRP